jgi:hypothetical protein
MIDKRVIEQVVQEQKLELEGGKPSWKVGKSSR